MTGPEPVAETAEELRERVARTLHMGLDDATPNDVTGDDTGHDHWVERVQEWADWIHEQYAEKLANARAEAIVEQAQLKGLTVEEGAAVLELGPPRALVIAWVDAARKMLGDAPNYSETRVDFPGASMEISAAGEAERYVFTVQRAGKVTPHEARVAVETERDILRAQVVAVRSWCDMADASGNGSLHASTIRSALDAAAAGYRATSDHDGGTS